MFRISQYLREITNPTPITPYRGPKGPVVIWNLIRRCNLTCLHCYSISTDKEFAGELSREEVSTVMKDLKAYGVPVLILSGGEPLLRPDILDIANEARDMGFYVGLSTNGTLIDAPLAKKIAAVGFNYVGISLDGIGKTHDLFRRKEGAFDLSLAAVRHLQALDVKVGLRYTMTQDNAHDLPNLITLCEQENVDKFYFSHLNYAGRGKKNRDTDAHFRTTRDAMDLLFDTALRWNAEPGHKEIVTGNNDADGVYLLHWAQKRFPESVPHLRAKLEQWGGNSSGVNISNIDNRGDVHPDTMWWHHKLGNVRQRPFSQIWSDTTDPLMAGLKASPRTVGGRCGECAYFAVCNGNTRVRAHQTTGDAWSEDPGCYLTDAEIGLKTEVTA
ncbi:MAG: heme d1 biosynthesis radical SAM protein NirJ [Rhodoferax sp.]|nr:MAG: heme d1 biosynthesis radical SAM protein NirJ [Rhodoferax sp.]